MIISTPQINLGIREAVLSAVMYFDVFDHPLTREEILHFAHGKVFTKPEGNKCIEHLLEDKVLFEHNGFILPHRKFENIEKRLHGEKRAEEMWNIARKKSQTISRFPFVRSVIISGSLSKNSISETSDIDYLIITHPGRLWISRTLLALYKKIFLLNSHKFFCVNYFLDLDNLSLSDRNIFTATELLFAVPMYKPDVFEKLLDSNRWAYEFYPNFSRDLPVASPLISKNTTLKKFLEFVFSGFLGNFFESNVRQLTKSFWNLKFRKMNRDQFHRDMKNTEGVSKHHPNGFRDRILGAHAARMAFIDGSRNPAFKPEITYANDVSIS